MLTLRTLTSMFLQSRNTEGTFPGSLAASTSGVRPSDNNWYGPKDMGCRGNLSQVHELRAD